LYCSLENTYAVDLVKGIYGLGFSTVGGHQDDQAQLEERVVRIKRVFPIGPAANSKVIHSGDVILAVNGQSVAGLSHTVSIYCKIIIIWGELIFVVFVDRSVHKFKIQRNFFSSAVRLFCITLFTFYLLGKKTPTVHKYKNPRKWTL
jgi:hypothetical protein